MTYEYICAVCSHEWEASQPISAPALTQCPKCKKQSAKRQVSGGTGFLLKGGGWYADLYSSPGASSKKAEAASGSDAAADAGAGSKADSAKSDSAKSDSAKLDSAKLDSAKSEPSKSEPKKKAGAASAASKGKPASD